MKIAVMLHDEYRIFMMISQICMKDMTDVYDHMTDLYDDMTDLYVYPWHVSMLVLWGGMTKGVWHQPTNEWYQKLQNQILVTDINIGLVFEMFTINL